MTREERAAHAATAKRWCGLVRSTPYRKLWAQLRSWPARTRNLALGLAAGDALVERRSRRA